MVSYSPIVLVMRTTRTMKPLHKALQELMAEREMTQTDLWASADLSPAVLSRYLSGKRGRRVNSQAVRTVEKLAAALGVEPEYFVEYRLWQVQEIARQAPELVDQIYDILIGAARLRRIRGVFKNEGLQ